MNYLKLKNKFAILLMLLSVNFYSQGQIAFFPVSPTGIPYNIIISNVTVDNNNLTINSQIAVFDDSLCVGVSNYSGQANTQLVAWQGDASQQLEGFIVGNQMSFKILTFINNDTLILNASANFIQGNGNFGFGTYSVVELSAVSGIISIQDLIIPQKSYFSVYPNPFTENLNFEFEIEKNTAYNISIYDISGKLIKTFSNEIFIADKNEISWNCKDNDGQIIPNGLYLISLQTNKINSVRKILKKL